MSLGFETCIHHSGNTPNILDNNNNRTPNNYNRTPFTLGPYCHHIGKPPTFSVDNYSSTHPT